MAKEFDSARFLRLKILDKLLSEAGDGYSTMQLAEKMTQILKEKNNGIETSISRKIVDSDKDELRKLGMNIIKSDAPIKTGNHQRAVYLWKYKDPESSLFNLALANDEEREAIKLGIEIFGGLKGFPKHIEKRLEALIDADEHYSIISSTRNPKEDKTISIWYLYKRITSCEVISIRMRDRYSGKYATHIVHPWYLREYNRRWYLFGYDETHGEIAHFALDRISGQPEILSKKLFKWEKPSKSIEEILKDVIGTSLGDGEPLDIVFWVSDKSKDFVKRKPLHSSQKEIKPSNFSQDFDLSRFNGGKLFKIKCKNNYELIRELMSFGSDLIVLSPNNIVDKIKQKLSDMTVFYNH